MKIDELGYEELKTLRRLTEKVIRKSSLGLSNVDELYEIVEKCNNIINSRDRILGIVDIESIQGKTFKYSGLEEGCFMVLGVEENRTDLEIKCSDPLVKAYIAKDKRGFSEVYVIFGDDADSVTQADQITYTEYKLRKETE